MFTSGAPAHEAVTAQLHYMMAPFLYAVVALLMVLLCMPRIISQNCAAQAGISGSVHSLAPEFLYWNSCNVVAIFKFCPRLGKCALAVQAKPAMLNGAGC